MRAIELAPPGPPTARQSKKELRAILQDVAESLVEEVEAWVRTGAAEDPLAAVSAFYALAEYCLPRLARVEQIQKPLEMSREEVEALLRGIGLDPAQVWDKLK